MARTAYNRRNAADVQLMIQGIELALGMLQEP